MEFKLQQNYPNPFNPTTQIIYSIPEQELVSLKVFDCLGREVKTLVDEVKSAGVYNVVLDGTDLSGGVYFYCVKAGKFSDTKKLVLLK